jgi:hypothetical protein
VRLYFIFRILKKAKKQAKEVMSTKIKRNKKPVVRREKKVKIKPQARHQHKDYGLNIPTANSYYYGGKYYPVGSEIYIGFNPYFMKPRKASKKAIKKSKKVAEAELSENEGEDVNIDNEEGNDGEEGEEIKIKKHKKSKKNNKNIEDEEDVNNNEEDNDFETGADKNYKEDSNEESEGDDDDSSESSEESIEEEPFKPYNETSIDFIEKKVNVLNKDAIEIINQMGLPLLKETKQKVTKLIPTQYTQKIVGKKLMYRGYDKYIVVNENGIISLKPYEAVNPSKATIIDVPIPDIPFKKNADIILNPPSNYKGPIKIGKCVKISDTVSEKLEGVLIRADDENFDIVTLDGVVHKAVTYKSVENSWNTKAVPKKFLSKIPTEITIKNKKFYITKTENIKKDNIKAKAVVKPPYVYGTFEREISTELIGIITNYTEDGFIVTLKKEDPSNPGTNIIEVAYDDASLSLCGYSDNYVVMDNKGLTAVDYLKLPVNFDTRQKIMKLFFKILSNFLPDLYDSDVYKNVELMKLHQDINWSVFNTPLKDWEDYYRENIKLWYFEKMYSKLHSRAPNFTKEAEEQYKLTINPVIIINNLTDEFGDIFESTGSKLLFLMNERAQQPNFQPSIIDVVIRRDLMSRGEEYLRRLSGKQLAIEISAIIANLIKNHPPPSVDVIKNRMINRWINDEVINHKITKKEREEYDSKFLSILKDKYNFDLLRLNIEKDKYNLYLGFLDNLKKESEYITKIQQSTPRLQNITVDGKQLSKKGILIADELHTLEEKIFIESEGKTNEAYLRKLIRILMFIDNEDVIGRNTEFIRAKLLSGIYKVVYLDSLGVVDILPELYANKNISKDDRNVLNKKLGKEIHKRVLDFINVFMLNTQPTITKGEKSVDWGKYLQPISKSCNALRIKKDVNYRGLQDLDNYDCESNTTSKAKVCKAKIIVEKVPDEDLIIYYDEKSEEFTCLSLTDILYAIQEKNSGKTPVNYITGIKYSEDFLIRMRNRYGDFLKSMNLPDRIMEITIPNKDSIPKKLPKIPVKKSPIKTKKLIKKTKK